MKIVVIEDEKLTAKDLIRTILAIEPSAEVVQQLQNVEDALEYFKAKPDIDLIFSDIQLGDGLSFEIFEQIDMTIPIIFCTAYNDFALKAFETSGIDYVLKPFSKQVIEKAITKFKTITSGRSKSTADFKQVFSSIAKQLIPGRLPNIICHQGDKIIPVCGDDIALFYIDNGMVKALSFEKKSFTINYKMEDLEEKFSPYFFRANRQFLLHRKAVKEASQHFNRKLLVHIVMPFSEQILVGKEKVSTFLEWLSEY